MKKLVIISVILLVAGIIITSVGLAFMKFDFSSVSTIETFKTTYSESDTFTDIEIKGSSSEVILIPHDETECKIVCTEAENITHTVKVDDGTLYIEKHDNRSWNQKIGIFLEDMVIEVYLPENEYNNLKIDNSSGSVKIREGFVFNEAVIKNTSGSVDFRSSAGRVDINISSGSIRLQDVSATEISLDTTSGSIKAEKVSTDNSFTINTTSGSIKIENAKSGDIDISASSGSINLTDARCTNVATECSSGSVKLTDVIASGSMKVKTSSGSVKLNDSDAADINVKTSSGSVNGTLLTGKMFEAHSSSGSVKVPASEAGGGICAIETSSGSIKISISSEK